MQALEQSPPVRGSSAVFVITTSESYGLRELRECLFPVRITMLTTAFPFLPRVFRCATCAS